MRKLTALVLVAGFSFATGFAQVPQGPPVKKLQITFEGSNVTLVAAHVSLPEILAEWARLSGCVMVNAERLSRAPIVAPIHFENLSQQRVLEALLRPAAGFILGPRTAARPGATDFEVVYILPTSNPTQSSYSGMNTQAPLSVEPPEVPPIPPPPPMQPAPDVAPPPGSRPTTSPGVYAPPIIAQPPSTTGRGTTPPPAGTTGRGGGGF